MSNPLFNALNPNSQNGLERQFKDFVASMKGTDPNEEIRKLLQSGRISQAQLNQAQQMAQQMRGIFKF